MSTEIDQNHIEEYASVATRLAVVAMLTGSALALAAWNNLPSAPSLDIATITILAIKSGSKAVVVAAIGWLLLQLSRVFHGWVGFQLLLQGLGTMAVGFAAITLFTEINTGSSFLAEAAQAWVRTKDW